MSTDFLSNKDEVLKRIVRRLGDIPLDYVDKLAGKKADNLAEWRAAGVLLPIFFRDKSSRFGRGNGEFVLQLIKRSAKVPQPGDLSCPGGMLHPNLDNLLRPFVANRIPPVLAGEARDYARRRGTATFREISRFLTNALRETWEETGLTPLNVRYLGALPSSDLLLFARTIFPIVGLVKKEWSFRLNWEVEKIVEIPLVSFFNPENYGKCTIEYETLFQPDQKFKQPQEYPCYIHTNNEDTEILWGASMNIIMRFLNLVFDFKMPNSPQSKAIKKILRPDYATGNQNRRESSLLFP